MAEPGFAADRLQFACDHAHERRLAFAVAPDEGDLLPALDFHLRMAENDFLRIADGQVAALENDVAGARRRREFHRQAGIVRLVDLDPVQLLQRLDAGLDLIGLGRLVAEGLDEFLRLLDHPLLVLVSGDLLLDTLRAQLQVFGIRDLVVVDMAQHHFHGPVRDRVQEAAVVADEQQRAATRLEVLLQPFDGLDVQVVGRLVEQQHVRLPEQDLGQLDAHVPALREGLRGAAELFVEEAQAQQRPAGLHLGRLRVAHFQAVMQAGQVLDQGGIGIGFVVRAGLQFARDARNLRFDRRRALESGHRLLQDRAAAVVFHDLRQVADREVLWLVHPPGGRALLVTDQFQDRGLPRAVLPDEADFVGLADMEIDLVQQDKTSIGDGHILDRDHTNSMLSKNSGLWKSGLGVVMGAQDRKCGTGRRSPHL